MKKKGLTVVLWLISLIATEAQTPTKKYVDGMIAKIADLIAENYVLPDKGDEIAKYFLNDHAKGRFYEAKNLKQLDSIMSKSLREVANDFHLFTWNNEKIVAQLQSENDKEQSESTSFFNDEEAYASNFGFERVEILPDNIGYIKLSQINISGHSLRKLYASMSLVEDTNALIIDLRDNHGGGSTVGSVLATFFFDKSVDLLEFRKRKGQSEIESTVPWLLEKRYLKPLYILINEGTGSAAEAFAFSLKSQDRCTLIGNPTSGGAYMNDFFLVNQDFIVAISTAAPFLPGTTESWEAVGVQPDHVVNDTEALDKALEMIRSDD